MGTTPSPAARRGRFGLPAGLLIAAVLLVVAGAGFARLLLPASAETTEPPGPTAAATPTTVTTPRPTPTPTAAPTATAIPTATPIPLVPAPLTGRLVTEAAARYRPVAVMVDDHADARPQAGFNAASVIWQAPAEGGIPRYMLLFQETIPSLVGPIRSTRQYYVEWAAETTSMLVHHGGSPEAQRTLARRGDGEWVYNADGIRWEPRFVWRVDDRSAPHDVMTDGEHLRRLADRVGAVDGPTEAAWQFAPAAPFAVRPSGGTIAIRYPYETITYRYEPLTNRYVRFINGSDRPQLDAADGQPVMPANVVILRMYFAAIIGDRKLRLESRNIGSGEAWISSNGITVKGTWRKASATAPTLLFGPDGEPIALTVGQTAVQVIALSYDFEIDDGPVPNR